MQMVIKSEQEIRARIKKYLTAKAVNKHRGLDLGYRVNLARENVLRWVLGEANAKP